MIHPRDEVWPGAVPTSTSGRPRPLLRTGIPTLTVHWTGAGSWLDPGDTPAELASIQRYATNSGKGWEYNFVVDGAGEVWTYAGDHQAAHSAGENDVAYGVLLLIGRPVPGDPSRDELPTDAMIDGFRRLRWFLESTGRLAAEHQVIPHRHMPGANTTCPSDGVMRRWDEFCAPWVPPAPPQPPTPEPPEEVDMLAIYEPVFDSPGYVPAWFVVFASGAVRRAVGPDLLLADKLGVPRFALADRDHYDELLRVSGSAYPARPR